MSGSTGAQWSEFDCPVCDAFNPYDTFHAGDEVQCATCGSCFEAAAEPDGSLRLEPP